MQKIFRFRTRKNFLKSLKIDLGWIIFIQINAQTFVYSCISIFKSVHIEPNAAFLMQLRQYLTLTLSDLSSMMDISQKEITDFKNWLKVLEIKGDQTLIPKNTNEYLDVRLFRYLASKYCVKILKWSILFGLDFKSVKIYLKSKYFYTFHQWMPMYLKRIPKIFLSVW